MTLAEKDIKIMRSNYKMMSKPPHYGEWWKNNDKGTEWFIEIFNARGKIHKVFIDWLTKRQAKGDNIDSILDVGCGRSVVYADLFQHNRYVGYDISEKEIDWCKSNRNHPEHDYICGDFLKDGVDEKFDLVFSHAVIDHIYDINAFVWAILRTAKKWAYITSYRGWFPDFKTHIYRWNQTDTCFYNDISPNEVNEILEGIGCSDVEIFPLPSENKEILFETVIIAKVPLEDNQD